MTYRVGVDIGGTFTDFCAFNEDTDDLYTLKVLSRPDEPGAEVIEGLEQLETRFGIPPSQIHYFTHGTTVGVNTVIQRKGIGADHMKCSTFGKQILPTLHMAFKAHRIRAEAPISSKESCCPNRVIRWP